MKILFASGTDTGIKRVRSELISRLISNGETVYIATKRGRVSGDLEKMGCIIKNVDVERHGVNPLEDLKLYTQFKRILKEVNPDVVLTFTTKPNVYCGMAARRLHKKVIMNITGMGTALSKKGAMQKLLVSMYQYATGGKNMRCIFFQNDDSMSFFESKHIGTTSTYKRIPGSGVNLEKFHPLPYPKNDKVEFLFVARIMKEKGIDEYISSAKEIRKQYSNAVFHVLGACDSDYEDKIKDAESKGYIVYHGQVDNMLDYQLLSSCTIHPSYYPEGMSNVILEAAACARPVITTDHPGCREGVENGTTGYIVPIKDSEALTKAIKSILDMTCEQREAMGLKARLKIENEFDREIVTNAYIKEIYQK